MPLSVRIGPCRDVNYYSEIDEKHRCSSGTGNGPAWHLRLSSSRHMKFVDTSDVGRFTMAIVRSRLAGVVALLVAAAFLASAVLTCVPAAMIQMSRMPAQSSSSMGSCDMGGGPCINSGAPMDCCNHPAPSLTATKADALTNPVRHVGSWLTSMTALVAVPSAPSHGISESPPDLAAMRGVPSYIALSILRI